MPYINEVRPDPREGETEVADDRLHLTFFWFGDFHGLPDALLSRIRPVIGGLERPSFRILLDRLAFGPRSVLLFPSEPLPAMTAFHGRMQAALAQAGVTPPAAWRYRPHMTLLYGRRSEPGRWIDPIGWQAGENVLIHSRIGSGRHCVIDRWPLRVPQPA
nr:2'-5' RNA ligase family protein [Sphingomonas profundi]